MKNIIFAILLFTPWITTAQDIFPVNYRAECQITNGDATLNETLKKATLFAVAKVQDNLQVTAFDTDGEIIAIITRPFAGLKIKFSGSMIEIECPTTGEIIYLWGKS